MRYSDLDEEEVKKIIVEIANTELYTDLVGIQQSLMERGKVNNEAWRFLIREMEERRTLNGKTRGGK